MATFSESRRGEDLRASAVRDLPNPPEYGRLKARWKRLTGATLAEDVLQFLHDIEGLLRAAQSFADTVHQLKAHRAALREQLPGPLLVWGVMEGGGDRV